MNSINYLVKGTRTIGRSSAFGVVHDIPNLVFLISLLLLSLTANVPVKPLCLLAAKYDLVMVLDLLWVALESALGPPEQGSTPKAPC